MDLLSRIVGKYILGKIFFIGWFLVTLSPIWLLMWLLHGNEDKLLNFVWITIPWILVCLIGSWLLGHGMAHYMVDEKKLFLDSVKWAWYELRFKLVFVPLIGHFFVPDEDKTKPDDDNLE